MRASNRLRRVPPGGGIDDSCNHALIQFHADRGIEPGQARSEIRGPINRVDDPADPFTQVSYGPEGPLPFLALRHDDSLRKLRKIIRLKNMRARLFAEDTGEGKGGTEDEVQRPFDAFVMDRHRVVEVPFRFHRIDASCDLSQVVADVGRGGASDAHKCRIERSRGGHGLHPSTKQGKRD